MSKKLIVITFCVFLLCKQNPILGEAPMDYKNVYFVILAGGSGTRLWPLSRSEKPKQFLAVGNKKTLLAQTIDRVCDLVDKKNIWISTTKKHKENIKKYVGNSIGHIIEEPGLRNTGPAILLACMKIYQQNPQASIIFLPADPFIPNKTAFVNSLKQAIDFTCKNNQITLLGLKPTYPATGYGYIEFDKSSRETAPFKVKKFHEKPTLEVAKNYTKKENMLWNIGMFCGKATIFLQEFKKEAPKIFQGVNAYVNGNGDYKTVKSDSIDYAVMEKSSNIFVLPVEFAWCDVGNIEVFLSIQKKHMQLDENVITVEANNNLVDTKNKLVALIGVDDLCIVETDDILLITKRNQAEKVKEIVNKLKKENIKKYL